MAKVNKYEKEHLKQKIRVETLEKDKIKLKNKIAEQTTKINEMNEKRTLIKRYVSFLHKKNEKEIKSYEDQLTKVRNELEAKKNTQLMEKIQTEINSLDKSLQSQKIESCQAIIENNRINEKNINDYRKENEELMRRNKQLETELKIEANYKIKLVNKVTQGNKSLEEKNFKFRDIYFKTSHLGNHLENFSNQINSNQINTLKNIYRALKNDLQIINNQILKNSDFGDTISHDLQADKLKINNPGSKSSYSNERQLNKNHEKDYVPGESQQDFDQPESKRLKKNQTPHQAYRENTYQRNYKQYNYEKNMSSGSHLNESS